jgi:PEP-CTERM/exosortase A-associated glycosyltransferase
MTDSCFPLKILHILDHSLPLHSGYAFRSQNILRMQRQRGWQPVALTSPKQEENWKGVRQLKEDIDGFCYYRTGSITASAFPLAAERRLMAALGRRLRKVVDVEKPTLLHVHSPILNAIPALRVGRAMGLPVVYEIRAFWEDAAVAHGTYGRRSWKYKFVQSLETWVCRKSDQVVVLCKGLRDDLIKRGIPAPKLTVVANGINLEDFHACPPGRAGDLMTTWKLDGKTVIGFVGSFYRYEGLDLLVEAVACLAATRSDLVLVLIGGGEMERDLKAQVQRLRLEEHVIIPGRMPHSRIPQVYTLMDILAYPRYATRLTELVTPLKPLEAMAMGKALVASDIGGHRELIRHGHTGWLFPAGNVAALAAALARLLDDQALRHTLGGQGAGWVRQQRPWDVTTAVYADIYAGVLGKSEAH